MLRSITGLGVLLLGLLVIFSCDSDDGGGSTSPASIEANFSVASARGSESVGTIAATIEFTETLPAETTLLFSYAGSALNTQDYRFLTPSPITVVSGLSSFDLQIEILEDTEQEADETIELMLEGASVISLGSQRTFTYTIEDND
ncbi:MAG: hypothetical protein D6675_07155 [Gemmatimonadetes bacterium]|nr:MAG: hypothetical protein D6675_07155 [Gemmatimonadota bacterium]